MAVVSSDFLSGVLTNFRTLFQDDFQAAMGQQVWVEIAMRVQSDTETESYNWFGTVPVMEDVTRQPVSLRGLPSWNFSITNKDYQAALEIRRSTLEDDKLGLIMPRVRQLGAEAARHPGELIFKLFEDNGNAFDGTAFFSNSRTLGDSGTIDNILTGTGTSVSQIQADLSSARSQMRKFKDDGGRPMDLIGNVIVVPPDLEQPMYQALNANQGNINQPVVPQATGKVFEQAGYKVIVNPYLTDANDWYLLHVAGATRPFVFQDRQAPRLEGITDPNSELVVIKRMLVYTVSARYNVGYGDPRHAVKITNS